MTDNTRIVVNACDFGLSEDAPGHVNVAALQYAIDVAAAFGGSGTIPAGTYRYYDCQFHKSPPELMKLGALIHDICGDEE